MRRDDGFFAAAREAALPLVIWSVHFFAAYVWVALACRAGSPAARAILIGASALALAWLLVIGVAAWRRRASAGLAMRPAVRLGAAALAFVAVGWSTLAAVVLPGCADWLTP